MKRWSLTNPHRPSSFSATLPVDVDSPGSCQWAVKMLCPFIWTALLPCSPPILLSSIVPSYVGESLMGHAS
jgi:hypothetical protein